MLMLMPMTEQEKKTIVQPMPKDAALYNEREPEKRNISLSVVCHILHTCDSLLCHAWLVLCDDEKKKQERIQTIGKNKKGAVSRTRWKGDVE